MSVAGAVIETEDLTAVVAPPPEPLIAFAMRLREIGDAVPICLRRCVAAVVQTLPHAAVVSHEGRIAQTRPIEADAVLAAVVGHLRRDYVNVDKDEGVRTIPHVASNPMPSVFARAPTQLAQSVTRAVLRTGG